MLRLELAVIDTHRLIFFWWRLMVDDFLRFIFDEIIFVSWIILEMAEFHIGITKDKFTFTEIISLWRSSDQSDERRVEFEMNFYKW